MTHSCAQQVDAGWELSQGCEPGTLVSHVTLSMGLLGLPHSMVTGFQECSLVTKSSFHRLRIPTDLAGATYLCPLGKTLHLPEGSIPCLKKESENGCFTVGREGDGACGGLCSGPPPAHVTPSVKVSIFIHIRCLPGT